MTISPHGVQKRHVDVTQAAAPSSTDEAASERVQLKGLGYAEQQAALAPVQQVAAEGVRGGGGAIPYQAEMEQAFGTSFADVSAHTGVQAKAACGAMGAEAYASGSSIAFAQGTPSRGLVAHELTHVVQQRQGVQLSGGVGKAGDSYEQQADAVAARVEAGQSARDLVGNVSGASGGVGAAPVQCYTVYGKAGTLDNKSITHWKAPNHDLRVSDDGTLAVAQPNKYGSQEIYVESGRIAGDNAKLKQVNAPFSLKLGGGSVKGGAPSAAKEINDPTTGTCSWQGGPVKTLTQVNPKLNAKPKAPMETPDDCGNAARTVTGAIASGKQLKAKYKGKDGKDKSSLYGDPELMKYEIMIEHFGSKIPNSATVVAAIAQVNAKVSGDLKLLKPHIDDLNKTGGDFQAAQNAFNQAKAAVTAAKGTGDKAKIKAAEGAMMKAFQLYQAALKKMNAVHARKVGKETVGDILNRYFKNAATQKSLVASVMKPYETLSEIKQKEFDKKVGINRYANPDVGESYTISSGGDPMKRPDGTNEKTWNFHWGGVILKSTSGSDNVTLENYAGSARTDWVSQMYGVPTPGKERLGQTFQEQHRDDHRQHGQTPTTMNTSKK